MKIEKTTCLHQDLVVGVIIDTTHFNEFLCFTLCSGIISVEIFLASSKYDIIFPEIAIDVTLKNLAYFFCSNDYYAYGLRSEKILSRDIKQTHYTQN